MYQSSALALGEQSNTSLLNKLFIGDIFLLY